MRLLVGSVAGEQGVFAVNGDSAVNLSAVAPDIGSDLTGLIADADLRRQAEKTASGGGTVDVADITPALPVAEPPTIICLGLNYTDHMKGRRLRRPRLPGAVHARTPVDHVGGRADGAAKLYRAAGLRGRTDGDHRKGRAAHFRGGGLLLGYLPDHSSGWIAWSEAPSRMHVFLALFAMLMTGVAPAALAGLLSPKRSVRSGLYLSGDAFAVVAGFGSHWSAKWSVTAGEIIESAVTTLIAVQAFVPVATWASILITDELNRRLAAIDGQQRITTLTLLLIALRDHIREVGWTANEDGPTEKRIEAYYLRNVQEEGEREAKL